jgi:hypothetical protein
MLTLAFEHDVRFQSLLENHMTWTSIRTKRLRISSRQRRLIDAFVRRTFHRELRHISSVVILLGPAKIGGGIGYACRVRIWSHYLGLIAASDVGDTVRTAVQQASLRARHAVRRRLHKLHDGGKRISRRHNKHDSALRPSPFDPIAAKPLPT